MIAASHIHGTVKAAEYLAGWQRAQAELENIRRRQATEQTAQRARLTQEVAEPLLEIADNFRAAVAHIPPDIVDNAWTEGVLHIARQVENALTALGVTVIEGQGGAFDPKLHEAVHQEPARGKPGVIIEVVQPGYRVGDRIIRPARVKVSA
ncbi:MAG: nucleotide exchange factor GrpE [Candidatus Andersenbacteria bacterium CG10_big_fil_rev_8_21_14_0_10_54_11]|uniref:Protein GrpE n=1 Tax=Candidatus Andersenbacteria bacterium CG10_big_fil_rev_8_21_14_0_10_54_11 TaxID=1974485 RepID=A0A2M6WYK4_9BACT|nr:MAG: nucleotide exchange factor GrpE [Candidatus Andersenbacteria bacterium CG10_big_fil_rev_8_21_14_0_10_54_11]